MLSVLDSSSILQGRTMFSHEIICTNMQATWLTNRSGISPFVIG